MLAAYEVDWYLASSLSLSRWSIHLEIITRWRLTVPDWPPTLNDIWKLFCNFLVVPLHFFALKVQLVVLVTLLRWSVQFGQFLVCCSSTHGAPPRAQPFVKVGHVDPCPSGVGATGGKYLDDRFRNVRKVMLSVYRNVYDHFYGFAAEPHWRFLIFVPQAKFSSYTIGHFEGERVGTPFPLLKSWLRQ